MKRCALSLICLGMAFYVFALTDAEEMSQWRDLLKRMPPLPDAVKMNSGLTFPAENEEQFFKQPHAICAASGETVYVTDSRQDMIFQFDKNGKLLKRIGRHGQGPGEFSNVKNICVNKKGNLVVYDSGNRRVQILDEQGRCLRTFKYFRSYYDMALDVQGRIVMAVIPTPNYLKIADVFNDNGKLLYSIGSTVFTQSHFLSAINNVRICIDANNDLWLAWGAFNQVCRFSIDGRLLGTFRLPYPLVDCFDRKNTNTVGGNIVEKGRGVRLFSTYTAIKPQPGGGVYVMRYYPRLEVVALTRNGKIRGTYWAEHGYDDIFIDFLPQVAQGKSFFYFLSVYPECQIRKFSIL